MHIVPRLRKLWQWTGYLFLFRRPSFKGLDCIDIIIDDKPLFLITWQLQDGHYIKIKPPGKVFYFTSGAAVIKISAGIEAITVVAGNHWRRRKERIPLTHYRLDDAAAKELILTLKPFRDKQTRISKSRIHNRVSVGGKAVPVKQHSVQAKKPLVYCPVKISVNKQDIQFPNS